MTAKEAFGAIHGGADPRAVWPKVVLTPTEERAVELLALIGGEYGRRFRHALETFAKAGEAYGKTIGRELDALAARLRETR